jgi:hypothetical protein
LAVSRNVTCFLTILAGLWLAIISIAYLEISNIHVRRECLWWFFSKATIRTLVLISSASSFSSLVLPYCPIHGHGFL